MATVSFENLVGTNSGETLTAVVRNPSTGVYFIQNSVTGLGGDDVLNALSNDRVVIEGTTYSFNNFLSGGDGGDTLKGGGGVDYLSGDVGNDTLNGGAGDDSILGGDGNDILHGDDGNDYLAGDGGADQYFGDNGDDTLVASTGATVLDGGSGTDTLVGNGLLNTATITGVEILMVNRNVTLTAAQINAFATLQSDGIGPGNSYAVTMATAGSIGGNFLVQANTVVTVAGSTGADTINLALLTSTLYLSAGDNFGGNVLTGGSGHDEIIAGNGGDTLNGGGGDDFLKGGDGGDTLNGGGGVDSMAGGAGNDILHGNDGTDYLRGDEGADQYFGDNGDDTLDASTGATVLDGGSGTDTLIGNGLLNTATITGVEILKVNSNITLTAAQINAFTTLQSTSLGNNYTVTMATAGSIGGNFLVQANTGVTVTGSTGADTINLALLTSNVSLSAGDNLGGNVLTGGSGNDFLGAGNGGDMLIGGLGADSLSGGASADYLLIDAADTSIHGGGGFDSAFVQTSAAVTMNMGTASIEWVQGNAGNDIFNAATQTRAVYIYGQGGDDRLTGSAFGDYIDGGDGTDRLEGGHGADILLGNGGSDILLGEEGDDSLIELGGDSFINGGAGFDSLFVWSDTGVTLNLSITSIEWVQGSVLGDDNLDGAVISVNTFLYGWGGNDVLVGGLGDDYIDGGTGDDVLTGGAGHDTLIGESGFDRYVYTATAWGSDTIQSFDPNGEKLDFTAVAAIDSFSDFTAYEWDPGNLGYNSTTLFYTSGGTTSAITLIGVQTASLSDADFLFA